MPSYSRRTETPGQSGSFSWSSGFEWRARLFEELPLRSRLSIDEIRVTTAEVRRASGSASPRPAARTERRMAIPHHSTVAAASMPAKGSRAGHGAVASRDATHG
jgi:hypothetical protein